MPTNTPNQDFQLPTVGSDAGAWGGYLNGNWTALDTLLGTITATDFSYLTDLTSSVQDQIDAKVDETDGTITTPTIEGATFINGYIEEVTTGTGTTANLDPDASSLYVFTATGAVTITLDASWSTGKSLSFIIYSEGYTATWPGTISWKTDLGNAPALSATESSVIQLWHDGTGVCAARVGDV